LRKYERKFEILSSISSAFLRKAKIILFLFDKKLAFRKIASRGMISNGWK